MLCARKRKQEAATEMIFSQLCKLQILQCQQLGLNFADCVISVEVKCVACGKPRLRPLMQLQLLRRLLLLLPAADLRSSNFWHLFHFNRRVLSSLLLGNCSWVWHYCRCCCCCCSACCCCCRSQISLCSWLLYIFYSSSSHTFFIAPRRCCCLFNSLLLALRGSAPVWHVACGMFDRICLQGIGTQCSSHDCQSSQDQRLQASKRL